MGDGTKKDVAILEGDKSRLFQDVEYLQTDLSNGDTCAWIPEGSNKTRSLRITKNGTYKASDYTYNAKVKEGAGAATTTVKKTYYGFDKVVVAIKTKKKIGKRKTGTDPSDIDNEYEVGVDDDGNISEDPIPSKIKITTLPEKQKYNDKEKIDIKGIVVKAYMNDGSIWDKDVEYAGGVIPPKYLKISPKSASRKEAEKDYATTDFSNIPRSEFKAWSSKTKNYPNPLNSGEGFSFEFDNGISEKQLYKYFDSDTQRTVLLKSNDEAPNRTGHCIVIISTKAKYTYSINNEQQEKDTIGEVTIDNKKYYYDFRFVNKNDSYRKVKSDLMKNDVGAIDLGVWDEFEFYDVALILFGGRRTEGKKQTITVTWERPQDGKPLTDTFKVAVAEEKPKEDDDNGNGYEGYPTH